MLMAEGVANMPKINFMLAKLQEASKMRPTQG
jgi:hypothetical protein